VTRIVLTTFGSLGDLHPYIAVALELKARGHSVVIATSENYRQNVETEGLEFAPVRPNMPDDINKSDMMRRIMDIKGGPEFLFRKVILPYVRESYDDLFAACDGADAIIGHPLTFAVPLVAKVKNIPWAYVALAPIVFISAYDPPLPAPAPWMKHARKLGPWFFSLLFGLVRLKLDTWFDSVRQLSRDLQVYPCQRHPMGADQYSEHLNIALFSTLIGAPQPDWPSNTVVTGFAFYDKPTSEAPLPPDLESFLQDGDPPIVFTLGSAAVNHAGGFYDESVLAAGRLGRRAILLIGRDTGNRPQGPLQRGVFVAEYASFSELFPRCCAIVHQGGVGTTAQALIAGRPMLIMPFAFDQPDNCHRIVRLGVGRCIERCKYTAASAAKELSALLSENYSQRARVVGRLMQMENGRRSAADIIESKLLGITRINTSFTDVGSETMAHGIEIANDVIDKR
jgi:UDP:flavonoid glycosyltransferase YjiC (YdhE family)